MPQKSVSYRDILHNRMFVKCLQSVFNTLRDDVDRR